MINNTINLEKKYKGITDKLGWQYTDVLYSFLGIYVLGLYVFYNDNTKENVRYKFEKQGSIIKPTQTQNNRQLAYSRKFIKEEYEQYKKLNELEELKNFISVYQSIGNIIPTWPGGNSHRGQNKCYDIPDVYFNKEKIKKYTNNFFEVLCENKNFYLDKVLHSKYEKIEDILSFNEDEYKTFLKYIINVIEEREKLINEWLSNEQKKYHK